MASIRWLFEKHVGKYEKMPAPPISMAALKDERRPQRPPVRLAFVLEAIRRYEEGETVRDIAIAMDSNYTTVWSIVKRGDRYSDLPQTKEGIIKYMTERNRA